MQTIDSNEFNINKETPFHVPDGYFRSLPVQTALKAERAERSRDVFMSRAIAASFLILLAVGAFMLMINNSSDHSHELTAIGNEVLANELELSDLNFSSIPNDPTVATINWELLISESFIEGSDATEIAEYLFEQDEFEF